MSSQDLVSLVSDSNEQSWHREPQAMKRRLLWLMGARLLVGTLLMGGTVLFQLKSLDRPTHPTENVVFWLVGATYGLTLLYSLLFPKIRQLQLFTTVQLSLDLMLVSALVLATGVHESIFLFIYLLVIIGAAVLLYRKGAFLFALGSLVSLGLLLSMTMIDTFRSWPILQNVVGLHMPEFFYILTVYGMAFFLTAFLSSHLSEQLRFTGEMLKQQQIDFDNLEALHQDIVRSLTSGLITSDLKGQIQFFNRSACEQTGLKWHSLFGKSLVEILPDLRPFLERMEQGEKKYWRLEIPFERPDGEMRLLGVSLAPLHNRHKRQNGVLLLFQDLTPLREMEEQVRRREKMAAVGEMAAGLAHEIRNPLSSLSGSIQLLQSELKLPDEHKVLMDIVTRETDRLNNLLGDFLLFARPKQLHKERVRLETSIQETLHLFAMDHRYEKITVEANIPHGLEVKVDQHLFHQVIWNLLLNAAQAMLPEEGSISLSAEGKDGGVWVYIKDTGDGIPKEIKERIFEPFFTTRNSGSGLGLAVVQRIVTEHGGHVLIEDAEPHGTEFHLFFPADEKKRNLAFETHNSSMSMADLFASRKLESSESLPAIESDDDSRSEDQKVDEGKGAPSTTGSLLSGFAKS